jgi:hypothetical protein
LNTNSRRVAVAAAVVLAAGVFATTACQTSNPQQAGTSAQAKADHAGPSGGNSSPPSTVASAAPVERTLNKTGWADGFAITADRVTATPQDGSVELAIALSYENMVAATHTPTDNAHLEVDGTAVDLAFDSPNVAGKLKGKGTATATVPSSTAGADTAKLLDNTVLVYGGADDNQMRIPFAAGADVDSIQPRGITVGQVFTDDKASVELSQAYLWPSYKTGEKDEYELWVQVDANCQPGCFGWKIHPNDFFVTSPTGKAAPADTRSPFTDPGPFDDNNLDKSHNIQGQWLVFVIDAPATGDYTFALKYKLDPSYGDEDQTSLNLSGPIGL